MESSDMVATKLLGPGHMTACLLSWPVHPNKHIPATWPHRKDGEENPRQAVSRRQVENEAIEGEGLQSRGRWKALD